MRTLILTTALLGLIAMPAVSGPATTNRTIPEVAAAAGSFDGLLKSVRIAGLAETLGGKGPFTVFAPTDAAFAKLPKNVLSNLLAPENRAVLKKLLLTHVVAGRVESPSLLLAKGTMTVSGETIPVVYRDGRLTVGGARVVQADIRCANGVIHVIDSVIVPSVPEKANVAKNRAKDIIRLAIDRGVPQFNEGNRAACAAIYEIAARSVVALACDEIRAEHLTALEGALDRIESQQDAGKQAWELRRVFDRILRSGEETTMSTSTRTSPAVAGFTVKKEAPMPEGFPAPGPVGEVVVKEYPNYRMARSSGSAAFGRLFMHIKRNDIPMTAPVEMTMDLTEDGRLRQRDMAFLYESPTKGRTGSTGRVTILDQGRSNVLSIGLRGPLTPAKLASARQSVETRLENTPGWRTAGDFRLMGYNSPFVPASQRFYELQLPVVREDSATE